MTDQQQHDDERAAALRQELRELEAAERAAIAAERAARPTGAGAVFIANVRALGGYHALDERGRAHFDAAEAMAAARRPVAAVVDEETEGARRLERARARDFARETLDAERALARMAGFRRLSRWAAAGWPIAPPAGRTPLPATRPAPVPRAELTRYPWDLPETAAQTERIVAQQGGGRARARELFAAVPVVTYRWEPAGGDVRPQGTRSRRRAERRAARAAS